MTTMLRIACCVFSLLCLKAAGQPMLPAVIERPATNRYCFAATATGTNGLESDFSNEVCATNLRVVTLAWDKSPGTNAVTNYAVYWGGKNGTYTNKWQCGTNLTVTLRLPWVKPKTNCVVTLTTSKATNILAANSFKGPWVALNATNWTGTNPTSPQYWRAVGKVSPTLVVSRRLQE